MQENNTDAIRKLFWGRLEGLLIEQGITKREAQWDYLGVSKSTLLNWKNGLALPGHLDLVRISHLLGCSVGYLIDETVTVKAAAEDIQAAIKTTGLSEKAVKTLSVSRIARAEGALKTVSSIIVSDLVPVQEKGIQKRGTIYASRNGAGVQELGLIAALHRNMEAAFEYEAEKLKLSEMNKEDNTPEELEKWFEQKRKVFSAQTKLENSGYRMMLTCTTATAEGQQYHETLKAEYMRGGLDDGEY